MSDLLGIHNVQREGKIVGTLSIAQDGLMTVFECECDYKSDSIMRLAGVSGGLYVKIGVMEPSGGILKLKKRFTKSALTSMKLETGLGFFLTQSDDSYRANNPPAEIIELPAKADTPPELEPEETREIENKPAAPPVTVEPAIIDPVIIEPVTSDEWTPIADPSVLFSDEDIANACRGAKGALTMQQDGITLLAIPILPGEPFPMMPVFCFGDTAILDGREYLIFKSRNGNFIM